MAWKLPGQRPSGRPCREGKPSEGASGRELGQILEVTAMSPPQRLLAGCLEEHNLMLDPATTEADLEIQTRSLSLCPIRVVKGLEGRDLAPGPVVFNQKKHLYPLFFISVVAHSSKSPSAY